MSDKFDEMANEAVRAYDTMAATRKRVSALVRRAVEDARAEEREAWKQARANFLDAKQALRDERDATRALLVHATDALEAFDATKANELRAAAIRARAAKEGK